MASIWFGEHCVKSPEKSPVHKYDFFAFEVVVFANFNSSIVLHSVLHEKTAAPFQSLGANRLTSAHVFPIRIRPASVSYSGLPSSDG